jgi:hypothetical protein
MKDILIALKWYLFGKWVFLLIWLWDTLLRKIIINTHYRVLVYDAKLYALTTLESREPVWSDRFEKQIKQVKLELLLDSHMIRQLTRRLWLGDFFEAIRPIPQRAVPSVECKLVKTMLPDPERAYVVKFRQALKMKYLLKYDTHNN